MKTMVTALFVAALLGGPLRAEDREPAPVAALIKLAQSGVGEDVQIAWVEGRPAYATVDVDTIIQLKDAKVSEKVIAVFIRNGGTATAERKMAAPAAEGSVKFLGRYEVPRLSADTPASKALTLADYEQVDRVVSVPSSVQYVYSGSYPRYAYSYGYGLPYSGYYGRYYYPYSRYRAYPYYSYFNDPYCYPRYYSGFGVSAFGRFRLGGTRVGLGFHW